MGSIPGSEDPLVEGMATHSSIFALRIPWTEGPGGLHTVHGIAKSWIQLKRFNTQRLLQVICVYDKVLTNLIFVSTIIT